MLAPSSKSGPFLSRAFTTPSWDLLHCFTLIVYRNDNLLGSRGRRFTFLFHIESSQCAQPHCLATAVAPENTVAWVGLEGLASSFCS